MKSFLISGDRSGSGKTSISIAIAACLSEEYKVQTFKVGMDYIDPSYLTGVTGRACRNLDSFVLNYDQIREIYSNSCSGNDIALIEGVRGLYEGADALNDEGSTASVAKALDQPVVLVVNARSITRSAAAIVKGFAAFDPDINIKGVILNQIGGERHREKAVKAIEHFCELPVIGTVPRAEEMKLTMRHLGLVPYLEGRADSEFLNRVDKVKEVIGRHLDFDALLDAAADIPQKSKTGDLRRSDECNDIRVAVAVDEAFNFYYADLFDTLNSCGADYVTFSPIHDRLPDADGYILGGGYPELFGNELMANDSVREAIAECSANGVPVYAECGGLIYLMDSIVLKDGYLGSTGERSFDMCGVFSGEARMPARRIVGYVEGESCGGVLGDSAFRGHEFHHTDVRLSGNPKFAYRLSRGEGIIDNKDGVYVKNTQGSYTHLHPVASALMLSHFVNKCRFTRVH